MIHGRNPRRLLLAAALFAPLVGCGESPEALSARLRRECTAIVDEALKEQRVSERGRQNMITECIIERGKEGRR